MNSPTATECPYGNAVEALLAMLLSDRLTQMASTATKSEPRAEAKAIHARIREGMQRERGGPRVN